MIYYILTIFTFIQMVERIYPTELQLNRANFFPILRHLFFDLNLCISNGTLSNQIYDKRVDFDYRYLKLRKEQQGGGNGLFIGPQKGSHVHKQFCMYV